MKRILVIGATSAIAQSVTRLFAKEDAALHLVARDKEKLASLSKDLSVRGASSVTEFACDVANVDCHAELLSNALTALGEIDIVFIAYGALGDSAKCHNEFQAAAENINVNFLSVVSLLTLLTAYFENRREGVIAVVTSVAGDRGRQSNYVYGAAKGGLSIYLQGLRNRLFACGVKVITIKPGIIDTPMTAHMKKSPLFANPEDIARPIVRAIEQGKDVVYVPWFWKYIMFLIKAIPEPIFKRLKL